MRSIIQCPMSAALAEPVTSKMVAMFNSGETWVYGSGAWEKLSLSVQPGVVYIRGCAIFDSHRRRLVAFGGVNLDYLPSLVHWEFDGSRWMSIPFTASTPQSIIGYACYSNKLRAGFATGGNYDFVVKNPTDKIHILRNGVWSTATAAAVPVPGRSNYAMAEDATGRMLIACGISTGPTLRRNETYAFDGATWTQLFPVTVPAIRSDTCLGYNPVTRKTVMFGGKAPTATDQTYEWNGTDWTLKAPAHKPTAGIVGAFAFDPSSGCLLRLGGQTYPGTWVNQRTLWSWDGTDWTELATPEELPAEQFPMFAPWWRGGTSRDASGNANDLRLGNCLGPDTMPVRLLDRAGYAVTTGKWLDTMKPVPAGLYTVVMRVRPSASGTLFASGAENCTYELPNYACTGTLVAVNRGASPACPGREWAAVVFEVTLAADGYVTLMNNEAHTDTLVGDVGYFEMIPGDVTAAGGVGVLTDRAERSQRIFG